MKIAGNHTIRQWKELKSILDINDNKNWGLAFGFFEERIKTRYLNPTDEILKMRSFLGEGFAIVNLQCSLIETIESFINGAISEYNETKRRVEWKKGNSIVFSSNKEVFKSFFDKREPFKSCKTNGEDFYQNVRCGLLHETQTKNNWKIRRNDKRKKFDWYKEENGFKIIYPYQLNNVLKSLITRYRKAIVDAEKFDEIENDSLRENFIEKMNHICTKSI